MKTKRAMGCVLVLLCAALSGLSAWGATGQAQLQIDQRGRDCPPNFGFAYYTADSNATDTCTTLDSSGNHTLVVTDAVASPENPEPVLMQSAIGDTVTFSGRTGMCYYMVTGQYGCVPCAGGGGGSAPSYWTADFDSSRDSHFVVYINERYNSDDDVFTDGSISTVYIEVANPANNNTVSFRLSQQSSDNGKIVFLQDDGITPEPLMLDGKTEKAYTIQPDTTQPNGPRVSVKVTGLDPGEIIVTATEVP